MPNTLLKQSPNILVVGDLMIDHYLWGQTQRISPEAPVPVVEVGRENSVLGGAGNVVNNLCALGAKVEVISVIGACVIADELRDLLADISVASQNLIVEKNRVTSKKTRIIAANQQVIRYDKESTNNISTASEEAIIARFSNLIKNCAVVILSDYGKGVLTDGLTKSLIDIANKHGKKVLVDPKGANYQKYQNAYLLTPNKKEASQATNINIEDEESLINAITFLKNTCKLGVSLITLSEQGVAIYDDKLTTHPTVAREVFDVTGAGDTVIASLGFALACGEDIHQSVVFANLAAGVVVGKIGSATASLAQISAYEASLGQNTAENRLKTLSEIINLAHEFKQQNKKIVFTNGCFDLLHAGHVRYLAEAKSFGDVLILGLNSDASVKQLKGDNRPINSAADRAYILASLESVDFVVIFDEQTPYNLINAIKPNVLVKGGDYEGKNVVGQEIADTLKLVNFVAGKSTTKTIEKIKNSQ